MKKSVLQKGFTLIELLLVIAIIAILAIIVLVALNPVLRFQQSRGARRSTDVETILSALHLYISDNTGALPTNVTRGMAERQLGTAGTGCAISTAGCAVVNTACLDLSSSLAPYLKTIPIDPSESSTSGRTGYSIVVDSNGIATIRACLAEEAQIHSSR
jgi:prepilin-type N-terminal cleavage/methylation domain-containing protein